MSIIHNNLGVALHSSQQVEQAVEHYRKAIKIDYQDARAHNNLGVAMQSLGEIKKAAACYRKAVEIDP